MDGKVLIKELKLKNFLSFGSAGTEVQLGPLNVLIGPNGSGKSNVINAISVLRAAPGRLARLFTESGESVGEWLWKGAEETPIARIESVVEYPGGVMPLRHRIAFRAVGARLEIDDEAVENEQASPDADTPYRFYLQRDGKGLFYSRRDETFLPGSDDGREARHLQSKRVDLERSVLSRDIGPEGYPEIVYLKERFRDIRIFRDWQLGYSSPPRKPQSAGLPPDFLEEDMSNVAVLLNGLEHSESGAWTRLLDSFRTFYPPVEQITTKVLGNTAQIHIRETGLRGTVPATRLSDGMLQYLCLLSILCHPDPPPLICIEEPEIGLHPDAVSGLGELLIEASQRMQLIVTTHSDALVSALTDVPEAVIVCERGESGTTLRRLKREPLKEWLEKYTLGDLWRMGEVEGNLW